MSDVKQHTKSVVHYHYPDRCFSSFKSETWHMNNVCVCLYVCFQVVSGSTWKYTAQSNLGLPVLPASFLLSPDFHWPLALKGEGCQSAAGRQMAACSLTPGDYSNRIMK